jgi:glycosyltransferase involved in cell wall biosynthesis
VSVVVATKDRPEFLPDCLASITAGLADGDELVVAEAGDSGAGSALARLDRPAVLVRVDGGGKSRQLNVAVARCANPVLLFTDDDCRAPLGWADAMAGPFQSDPGIAIAFGPVVGLTDLSGDTPAVVPPPGDAPFATWTYAHGASLAVRRTALLDVGGFDERLGPGAPAHGEEHDLLLRLREQGWRAVIASAPPVQHLEWRDDQEVLANLLVYERGSGAFLGAALRRAPRQAWPLLKQRLGYQLALFGEGRRRGWLFGPRTLAAFGGGLVYGIRLRPPSRGG